jgi:sensor histidine kinase regulating citrate/malate metabolism
MLTTEDLQILSIEASHNGIMAIDCSGTIIIYNMAAKNIFNFVDIDLVGEKISKFRPNAWKDMQVIIKTGVPQIGKKIVLPEATIIANRTPIYDNDEIVGIVSVFQDVSEHEKIVSQMQNYKKLHKELEVIFESSYCV